MLGNGLLNLHTDFFIIFATKNPSYKSVGFTHNVPGILVGSNGKFSIPSNDIGSISVFPSFSILATTSSFSHSKIEQVEYTISCPGFNRLMAFRNKFFCVTADLSINCFVKYFSIFWSLKSNVPLPLHGASSNIWSNEKKLSIYLESFSIINTHVAPCLSILYFNLSARILFFSHAVICALLFVSAAICVVFPPGAAAMSNMSVLSFGSNIIGGNIDDRLCRYISPFLYIDISCIVFSFVFFIISASLFHGISSYSMFFSFNSFFIVSMLLFIVFTLSVVFLSVLYPSIIVFVVSFPYCFSSISSKNFIVFPFTTLCSAHRHPKFFQNFVCQILCSPFFPSYFLY